MGYLWGLILLADVGCQRLVDLASDVAFEAADDLSGGLAFGGAPGYVGLVRGSVAIRVKTICQRAELACRSPPWLRR